MSESCVSSCQMPPEREMLFITSLVQGKEIRYIGKNKQINSPQVWMYILGKISQVSLPNHVESSAMG